ncbi:MAG TPA: LysR family transcriptional regulator, partial [Verrucomicrobiales bacterium]|nr:LysR family transcriptional regulator [Verrucomicrobiales bacterium]
MEMHQLRYVVAVAHTGNFSRAAEQCHVSQPSLSQQIQKLEDELGERLFDRLQRAVKLTSAGETFLPHAHRILDEVEAAKREATDAGKLVRGNLSIGVLPTIAPYLLPSLLTAYTKRFPGVDVMLHEDVTARVLRLALRGDVDLALTSLPLPDARFEVSELFAEELLLALPLGHPLLHRQPLSLGHLGEERFIVMQEGHCLGDQVLSFCDRRDLSVKVRFRSAQLATILALVGEGMGVSLIPAMAAKAGAHGVEFRSLTAPRPQRAIVAARPRQRPPSRAATECRKSLRAET